MAGEELVFEVEDGEETAPGLLPTSVKLQLTYFESTVVVDVGQEIQEFSTLLSPHFNHLPEGYLGLPI